jgi:protein TonB
MADLFAGVVSSRPGHLRRWWSSVPCSIAVHALVIGAALIVPLAASGALPTPSTMMVFTVVPPPPPPRPPVVATPAAAVSAAPTPIVSPVPTEAPTEILEKEVPVVHSLTPPSAQLNVGASNIGLPVGDPGSISLGTPPPVGPKRAGIDVKTPVKVVDAHPVYPVAAKAARVEGTVIIEAVIGIDGRVTEARVLRSSPLLDRAALEAVGKWRYSPTTLDGVPVPVILTVTVNFTLR